MDDLRVIIEELRCIFPQYSKNEIVDRIINRNKNAAEKLSTDELILRETMDSLLNKKNLTKTNQSTQNRSVEEDIKCILEQTAADTKLIKNLFSDVDPECIAYLADLGYGVEKIIDTLQLHFRSPFDKCYEKYLDAKKSAEATYQCKSCTEVVLISNMVSCMDGHLICRECFRNGIEDAIINQSGVPKCEETGCDFEYPLETLQLVLRKPMFEKYLQAKKKAETECECNVCCETVVISNMVSCTDGHLVCRKCLRNYAREVIYGQAQVTLTCLDSECNKPFTRKILQSTLDSEWMEKLDERVQVENINGADIPNLYRCKFCHYAVVIDAPIGRSTLFKCQNANCQKRFCLFCGVDWEKHDGNSCETDNDTSFRKNTEEKMTEAIVRECHKCKAKIVKEDGCNRMTCRCGASMCYVCRQRNIDYGHFCPHLRLSGNRCTKCNACSLWEDVRRTVDANNLAKIKNEAKQAEEQFGWYAGKIVDDRH